MRLLFGHAIPDLERQRAGDIQPFLALGQRLVKYGHRVRIATHETFRSFVKEASIEFFNIGGDPKDLMSYMVKSNSTFPLTIRLLSPPYVHKDPGLIPGVDSLLNGDIGRKRKMIAEARVLVLYCHPLLIDV